jgi:U3 small nucleolar RNA-associated protein 5
MLNYSAFNSDGTTLAGCVSTSSVRFWHADSSAATQEFVPSSNLSSACSCINWLNSCSSQSCTSKRKSHSTRLSDLHLIAIGTLSGSILLYSTSKSQLHSQLDGAHSVAITSLTSSPDCDELYSAASDGVVARWSLSKSVLIEKWKAEKHAVQSLCICPTSRLLITASRKLKLWNIDTQQLLCTFGAHTSKIICVRELLPSTSSASPLSSPLPPSSNWPNLRSDLFFVSAASQDRHLYLWRVPCVDAESGEKSDASAHSAPLASFALTEEPLVFSIAHLADQVFLVAAVTVSGQLLLFEYTLNG